MTSLLKLAHLINAFNQTIGRLVGWLILLAVIICTGNALMRYTFSRSSNAWLEIQWYLFAGVFLLGAAYTLGKNEHVRIDVISGRLSFKAQVWIDLLGTVFFLWPLCYIMLDFSIPYALKSIQSQEMSQNAGGLIVWPARLLIPLGFVLLLLQGLAELIKRIGFLTGHLGTQAFEKETVNLVEAIAAASTSHASTQTHASHTPT